MQRSPEAISPVESHLAYWVNYTGYRLAHQLRLRSQQFGVTAAEWVVLRKLYEKSTISSHLALRLGLNRSTVSRLAVRLEAKGFLNRKKSVSDRRTLSLTLTDTGRALVPVLAAAADKTNARNFTGIGDAPLEIIERVIKWIVYRHQYRFVPPGRCRVRKYHYLELELDIDWDGDGDEEGGDGEQEGVGEEDD
jgi:DNA-binding MarR family transcriptional regulator